ncbi:MAG: hypothetical protein PHX18_05850 [Candidatus Gastranaerophilales bacterium]|nr:hypothetical protein [Candidatus Gastranaerophilales bacterium]
MYQVYVETKGAFAPDLLGEFSDLEEAREQAKKAKQENLDLTYLIEKTDGTFDSYGELLTTFIERG